MWLGGSVIRYRSITVVRTVLCSLHVKIYLSIYLSIEPQALYYYLALLDWVLFCVLTSPVVFDCGSDVSSHGLTAEAIGLAWIWIRRGK